MKKLLLIFVAVAFAIQCAPGAEDLEVTDGGGSFERSTMPIFNGSPPDAPEHEAVVSLHQIARGSVYVSPFCSGTLISPDVVVTAAHCLTEVKGKRIKVTEPSAVAVYVGGDPSLDILDHLYLVTEVAVYPTYDPRTNVGDIALIRLASAISESVAPVPALPASLGLTDADIGATLNFAGFGQTETGGSGVLLQVDLPLGGLGCTVEGCPDAGDSATMISYAQVEAGPCFGDSGGPAFFYREGVPYVAGVTSYGDQWCTIYGVSTRTDAFDGWISEFVYVPDCSADAVCNTECDPGADPDCSTGPDCSADGVCNGECDPGADPDCFAGCGDGVCGAGESCDGRDGTVECEDCAGRTGGKPSRRYCIVEGVCIGQGCP